MELVETIRGKVLTSSVLVAEKFGVRHHVVLLRLEKLNEDRESGALKKCSTLAITEIVRGKEVDAVLMDKKTFLLLSMRFRGKKAVQWQDKFADAFMSMEKELMQIETNRNCELWVEERESTKIERKGLTDVVKDFVHYARECDSKNATRYYSAFTKLAYRMAGADKPRDTLSASQLHHLADCEDAISDMIAECMALNVAYKLIYKNVRKRVEDTMSSGT